MHTTHTIDSLLAERFSCREFQATPIDPDVIDDIVALAARTPSWCNTQPWHLHVTTPETTDKWRTALADHLRSGAREQADIAFPSTYAGEYAERRKAAAWQLYEAVGVEHGDRAASMRQTMRNFDFFQAPHLAILTTEADLGTYGAVDCGLFIQSFLLAARSRGIDAIPQAALASQAPFFRAQLDLPASRQIVIGISFGYADADAPTNSYRTPRKSLEETRTIV